MILVAFVLFFLLVIAWLLAPSKTQNALPEPTTPVLVSSAATA